MALPPDLVGNWKLCETSGTTAFADVGSNGSIKFGSGSSRDASNLYTGAGNGPGGSLVDCGFDFDDVAGEYIELGNIQTFTNTTICCWVKSSNQDGVTRIYFDDRDGAGSGMGLSRSLSAYLTILWESGRKDGSTEPHDGTWHHVAGTYDGTTLKLFIDGVEEGSGVTAAGLTNDSAANATIGRRSFGTRAGDFGGVMADVRIYENDIDSAGLGEIINLAKPTFTTAAAISGTLEVGTELTATYVLDDDTDVSWSWEIATDGSGTGATPVASTLNYTPVALDAASYIRVTVTATSNAQLVATSQTAWQGPIGTGASDQTWDIVNDISIGSPTLTAPSIDGSAASIDVDVISPTPSVIDVSIDGSAGAFDADVISELISYVTPSITGADLEITPDVITPTIAYPALTIDGSAASISVDVITPTISLPDISIDSAEAWSPDTISPTPTFVDPSITGSASTYSPDVISPTLAFIDASIVVAGGTFTADVISLPENFPAISIVGSNATWAADVITQPNSLLDLNINSGLTFLPEVITTTINFDDIGIISIDTFPLNSSYRKFIYYGMPRLSIHVKTKSR